MSKELVGNASNKNVGLLCMNFIIIYHFYYFVKEKLGILGLLLSASELFRFTKSNNLSMSINPLFKASPDLKT